MSSAFGLVHDYFTARPTDSLDVSQRGMVACGFGPHVQVWKDALVTKASAPYMRHTVPGQAIASVRFRPFEDVLGVGHSAGVQTLLVPGAGEPHTDTRAGLDPHETLKMRRDRDVREALDKLLPDTIALDPRAVGAVDRAPADVILAERRAAAAGSAADDTEEGLRRTKAGKSRGRSHSSRLRAKRQANVVTKAKMLLEERNRRDREKKQQQQGGRTSGKANTATAAAASVGSATRALRRFF